MKYRLLLFLLVLSLASFSQQRNTHNIFWTRLTVADTITERLKWEISFQQRRQNNYAGDPNIFHSFQFRSYTIAFQYDLSPRFSLSVMPLGYYQSHVLNIMPTDWKNPSSKEWRSNIQLSYETNIGSVIFLNRIALDYRRRDFQNTGEYKKNYRFRYMMRFEKRVKGILSAVKPVTFTIFDEVFFQFGDAVKNNAKVFDQNRLYAGAGYEIFKHTTLSLGYAYGFQIRPSGEQYDDINYYYVALKFDNFISQFVKRR